MYGFQPVLWSQRFWKHDTTIIYRDQPQFYKEAQGGAKIKSTGKKGSIHLIKKMKLRMARGEVYLRVSAILVLVLTACLVALDTQTKVVFLSIEKKATCRDLNALK